MFPKGDPSSEAPASGFRATFPQPRSLLFLLLPVWCPNPRAGRGWRARPGEVGDPPTAPPELQPQPASSSLKPLRPPGPGRSTKPTGREQARSTWLFWGSSGGTWIWGGATPRLHAELGGKRDGWHKSGLGGHAAGRPPLGALERALVLPSGCRGAPLGFGRRSNPTTTAPTPPFSLFGAPLPRSVCCVGVRTPIPLDRLVWRCRGGWGSGRGKGWPPDLAKL